jgi:hypothetical protein
MVELKGTEKQIKWAEDIRNRIIKVNEIFEKATEGIDMDKMKRSTWIDDNMYVIAQTSLKNILVQEEAKFFIENFRDLKDYMIENTLLYEPKKQVEFIWSLVKKFENM